jgi:hypothetical protein
MLGTPVVEISQAAGTGLATPSRVGRVTVAAWLLVAVDVFLLGVWVIWMPGLLTGHPASTNPDTGLAYPWPLLLASGPVAAASLFAAWRALRLEGFRLVVSIAAVAAAFAVLAVAAEWAKPVVLLAHLGALGLLWSGRSAFRS